MRSSPDNTRWLLQLGALLALTAASALACSGEDDSGSTTETLSCEVGYEDFAGPFVLNWCVGCHSSALSGEARRKKAPEGVDFDTLEGLRKHAENVRLFAVEQPLMPPLGGPSAEDRELFGKWIDCGMPARGEGFDPPAPAGEPDEPPLPTGTCAMPRQYLPESVLPRCKASTLDCVIQCSVDNPDYGADTCRDACLAADGTPAGTVAGFPVDCPNCTLAQLLACADQDGCHDETARFLCCLEGCGGGDACNQQCAGELQAFGLCVYYSAPHCVDYAQGPIGACFAEEDPSAGGAAGAGGQSAGGLAGAGGSGG